jgi:hypothetical protein
LKNPEALDRAAYRILKASYATGIWDNYAWGKNTEEDLK